MRAETDPIGGRSFVSVTSEALRRRTSGEVLHAAAATGVLQASVTVDERSTEERVSCVERGEERCVVVVWPSAAASLRLLTRVVLGERPTAPASKVDLRLCTRGEDGWEQFWLRGGGCEDLDLYDMDRDRPDTCEMSLKKLSLFLAGGEGWPKTSASPSLRPSPE